MRAQSQDKPGLCIVCSHAYPLFDTSVRAQTGGMETRAALFARLLAASGRWNLTMVVGDFGQPFEIRLENIDFHIYQPTYRKAGRNVFPRLRKRRWFPALNFEQRDLDLFWQIPLIAAWLIAPTLFFPRFWRRLNPDVVCCFGNNALSAEVIADCKLAGIRTMLCIASDKDLSPDYRPGNRELNHYGMPKWKGHYALTQADRIIVQTETQRTALKRDFGRDGSLIRNPVQVSAGNPHHWVPRGQREYVLWIGRADGFNKRPMIFLELARACPEQAFTMIVSRGDDLLLQTLLDDRPENLRVLEQLPASEVGRYLSCAQALVNTSRFEGFPNTFLQAAVAGVPIVSLDIDPDGMLASCGCGICVNSDMHALRKAVMHLCSADDMAERYAQACHRYVLERHEAHERAEEFAACIDELRTAAYRPPKRSWRNLLCRYSPTVAKNDQRGEA